MPFTPISDDDLAPVQYNPVSEDDLAPIAPVDTGFSGAISSGLKGAYSGIKQTAQTLAGQTPTADVNQTPAMSDQPWAVSDLVHPKIAAEKLVKGLVESSPTMAGAIMGGVGGGAIGSAIPAVGTGVGAVTGTVLGAGVGGWAQSLGPSFVSELQKTPDDLDGAYDRAKKTAIADGVISGAAMGLFEFKPFEYLLKNQLAEGLASGITDQTAAQVGKQQTSAGIKDLALQAGVVQPAVSVAGGEYQSNGQMTPEQMASTAIGGAASTLVPMAVHKAVGTVMDSLTPGAASPQQMLSPIAKTILEPMWDMSSKTFAVKDQTTGNILQNGFADAQSASDAATAYNSRQQAIATGQDTGKAPLTPSGQPFTPPSPLFNAPPKTTDGQAAVTPQDPIGPTRTNAEISQNVASNIRQATAPMRAETAAQGSSNATPYQVASDGTVIPGTLDPVAQAAMDKYLADKAAGTLPPVPDPVKDAIDSQDGPFTYADVKKAVGQGMTPGDVKNQLESLTSPGSNGEPAILAKKGSKYVKVGTDAAPIDIQSPVDTAIAEGQTNLNPTDEQKETGNYDQGAATWNGLPIKIETPEGATRTGTDDNGEPWSNVSPAAYGYIPGTEAADGEPLDMYMGPNPKSDKVFVVDQRDPVSGEFDETKSMLGFDNLKQAIDTYDKGFSDKTGPMRRAAVTEFSVDDYKDWLEHNDTTKAAAPPVYDPRLERQLNDTELENSAQAAAHADTPFVATEAKPFDQEPEAQGSKPVNANATTEGNLPPGGGGNGEANGAPPEPVRTFVGKGTKNTVGRPQSLIEWIAHNGGIKPDGDLKAMDAHKAFIPGLGRFVRDGGKPVDYVREAAVEAGYPLPNGGHGINDLYDAIRQDMAAQKAKNKEGRVYAASDLGDVQERNAQSQHEEAVATVATHRQEIDRLDKDNKFDLSPHEKALALELSLAGHDTIDAIHSAMEEAAIYGEHDAASHATNEEDPNSDIPFDAPIKTELDQSAEKSGEESKQPDPSTENGISAPSQESGEGSQGKSVGDVIGANERENKTAQTRAEEEARLRGNQSKMRRGDQEGVDSQSGGLFENKTGGLFDPITLKQERPETVDNTFSARRDKQLEEEEENEHNEWVQGYNSFRLHYAPIDRDIESSDHPDQILHDNFNTRRVSKSVSEIHPSDVSAARTWAERENAKKFLALDPRIQENILYSMARSEQKLFGGEYDATTMVVPRRNSIVLKAQQAERDHYNDLRNMVGLAPYDFVPKGQEKTGWEWHDNSYYQPENPHRVPTSTDVLWMTAVVKGIPTPDPITLKQERAQPPFYSAHTPGVHVDQTEDFKSSIPAGKTPSEHAADWVRQQGKITGNEHYVAIDGKTGEAIAAGTTGQKTAVDVSPELGSKLMDPNNNIDLHHNHNLLGSLSAPDISALFAAPGIKRVIAHDIDGNSYSAEQNTGKYGNSSLTSIGDSHAAAFESIENQLKKWVNNGVLTSSKALDIKDDLVNRALDRAGIIEYKSTRPPSEINEGLARNAINNAVNAIHKENGTYWGIGNADDIRSTQGAISLRPDEGVGGIPRLGETTPDGQGLLGHEGSAPKRGDGTGKAQNSASQEASVVERSNQVGQKQFRGNPPESGDIRAIQSDVRDEKAGLARSPTGAPILSPSGIKLAQERSQSPEDDLKQANRPIRTPADLVARVLTQAHNMVPDYIKSWAASYKPALVKNLRALSMGVNPMALGSDFAQGIVKEYANWGRATSAEATFLLQSLEKEFGKKSESYSRMNEALKNANYATKALMEQGLDKDSAMAQARSLHIDTLPDRERDIVSALSDKAQAIWQWAQESGLVEGEGQPFWTPHVFASLDPDAPKIAVAMSGLPTETGSLKARKYATEEEALEAFQKGDPSAFALNDIRMMVQRMARVEKALAGRMLINQITTSSEGVLGEPFRMSPAEGYFTVDGHPAFQKISFGGTTADGNPIVIKKQMYVPNAFEGPLKAVMTQPPGAWYKLLRGIQLNSTGLIMYSPLIHRQVVAGKAMAESPIKGLLSFVGLGYASMGSDMWKSAEGRERMMQAGMIDGRSAYVNEEDIKNRIIDPNNYTPESNAGKLLGALFNKVSPEAAEKAAMYGDNASDLWHNKLLWDNVRNTQAGIFLDMSRKFQARGMDETSADRMAADFSNRLVGAIPPEAMSAGLTRLSSLLLFSRSFTFSNLGLFKDAFAGASGPTRALIERDYNALSGSAEQIAAARAAYGAKSSGLVAKAAVGALLVDLGASHVVNSLVQSAFDYYAQNKTGDEIMDGYVARANEMAKAFSDNPLNPGTYLEHAFDLDPTQWHETKGTNRILTSYNPDGSANYMRLPTGKVAEDLIKAVTDPRHFLQNKESPIVKPMAEVFSGTDTFGNPIYDQSAIGIAGAAKNVGIAISHIVQGLVPTEMLAATSHIISGNATKADYDRTLGDWTGLSHTGGYPGGPEEGIQAEAKKNLEANQRTARKGIIDDIQHANETKDPVAQQKAMSEVYAQMASLKMTPGEQKRIIQVASGTVNTAKKRAELNKWFQKYGTPQQQNRVAMLDE